MIDARHYTSADLPLDDCEDLDLRGADLRAPEGWRYPNFSNCDLRGADFRGAWLHLVEFVECLMEGVRGEDRRPTRAPGYIREIVRGRSGVEWVRCYRTARSTSSPYPVGYEYGDLVEAFPWLDCSPQDCAPGIGVWYTWEDAHLWAARFRDTPVEVWTFAHLIHDAGRKSRAAWVIVGGGLP